MSEKRDLLFLIEKIIELDEFWSVNYYLRSMKKAPHGGIVRIYRPNVYLRHYSFQAWTLVTRNPEVIPYFLLDLVDKAVAVYSECVDIDMEELLNYCFNGDNWYIGFRLLKIKPEYEEQNKKLSGALLMCVLNNNEKILDYFDIDVKCALYALILHLVHDKSISIKNLNEILSREKLQTPHNKYGLSKLCNADFFRQGFRIKDKYYLYNIFLDPTIGSPYDTMPYTLRVIVDEIPNANIFMRCDNNLALPFEKRYCTATVDFQKYRGIIIDFANIEKLIQKEIIVHIHAELLHKIVMIVKPDKENGRDFFHIEVEQLWNPSTVKDDIVIANFIHSKYFPFAQAFTHIDFSVNQYNADVYKAKYIESVSYTGVPIDKYGDVHYKIWCVENNKIDISTWSKLVCATLDEPFRDIFLETFNH